jgi:catechol 2,3-dioxygenase-like lactoylglutathione lyase family enzyme
MFNHVMLGSNDIARSKTFYDALLAAIGGRPGRIDDRGRLMYIHRGGVLLLSLPIDGHAATVGNGSTLGFAAANPAEVDAWHSAGVEHGGMSVEDPPGMRIRLVGRMYLAYLRDPDGNKVAAVHRMEG